MGEAGAKLLDWKAELFGRMAFSEGDGLAGGIELIGSKGVTGATVFVGNGPGRGPPGLVVPKRLMSPGELAPNR